MKRPSSQYLTHPYPAWSGCTLNEIVILYGLGLLCTGLGLTALALLIGQSLFGFFCFLLWIPLTFMGVKTLLKAIEPLKERKQTGFMLIIARLMGKAYLGVGHPYLTRQGPWDTRY